MLTTDFRIARVRKSLEWFESDIPLLNMRVKELSAERQESARHFAAAVVSEARAELERLLRERWTEAPVASESPCEPAD